MIDVARVLDIQVNRLFDDWEYVFGVPGVLVEMGTLLDPVRVHEIYFLWEMIA